MGRFRVSRAALRDLAAIGRYTRERWGEEQCRRYLTALDARFHHLADHPASGQACDDVRPGYRCWHEGKHAIFYRMTRQGIDVIRVLHERMLPDRYL